MTRGAQPRAALEDQGIEKVPGKGHQGQCSNQQEDPGGEEAVGRCAWHILETAGWGWRGGVPRRDLTEQMETHSRKLGHWGKSEQKAQDHAPSTRLCLFLYSK